MVFRGLLGLLGLAVIMCSHASAENSCVEATSIPLSGPPSYLYTNFLDTAHRGAIAYQVGDKLTLAKVVGSPEAPVVTTIRVIDVPSGAQSSVAVIDGKFHVAFRQLHLQEYNTQFMASGALRDILVVGTDGSSFSSISDPYRESEIPSPDTLPYFDNSTTFPFEDWVPLFCRRRHAWGFDRLYAQLGRIVAGSQSAGLLSYHTAEMTSGLCEPPRIWDEELKSYRERYKSEKTWSLMNPEFHRFLSGSFVEKIVVPQTYELSPEVNVQGMKGYRLGAPQGAITDPQSGVTALAADATLLQTGDETGGILLLDAQGVGKMLYSAPGLGMRIGENGAIAPAGTTVQGTVRFYAGSIRPGYSFGGGGELSFFKQLIRNSGVVAQISLPAEDGFGVRSGEVENDRYGTSVAGLGDVNSDGLLDFLAGAPGAQGERGYAEVASMTESSSGRILKLAGSVSNEMVGYRVGSVSLEGAGRADIALVASANKIALYPLSCLAGAPLTDIRFDRASEVALRVHGEVSVLDVSSNVGPSVSTTSIGRAIRDDLIPLLIERGNSSLALRTAILKALGTVESRAVRLNRVFSKLQSLDREKRRYERLLKREKNARERARLRRLIRGLEAQISRVTRQELNPVRRDFQRATAELRAALMRV